MREKPQKKKNNWKYNLKKKWMMIMDGGVAKD